MSNSAGTVPEQRPRTATARHTSWAVLHTLAGILAACLMALGTADFAAAASSSDDLVKVFVVEDPTQSGTPITSLQAIAATTLGDGARANEILDLNRDLAQKDGGALRSIDDVLRPGWILRLPQDASGPGVRLARDTATQEEPSAPPADGAQTIQPSESDANSPQSTMLTIPLAAAIAIVGAVLLALVTAGIVGRRKVRAACTSVSRTVDKLGDPARRRRRRAARQNMSRQFAADFESVRRAYAILSELSATNPTAPPQVHALRVDDTSATVWLPASDAAEAPWTSIDTTRWQRSTANAVQFAQQDGSRAQTPPSQACLVRAGTDSSGQAIFVDLSHLDSILSVTGDQAVARDVVQNLLEEIARILPSTPVIVRHGAGDSHPLTVPAGLQQIPRTGNAGIAQPIAMHGTVRSVASRRALAGLVVVAGTPSAQEAAELADLCGPGGPGWTGLVYGEVDSAHWRWYTDDQGHVDIPVLGLQLSVPA
ncbi:hypothetical protein [Streptomyces fructofermentans]|uniref:hypothetical protein n=1 Tax=Streptomyces fructofermentans TaxID=152141 RepID=UPI0033F97877